MNQVKNPFGLRNGAMITISDLMPNESGMNCNCICPDCNGAFIARMGEIRVHHFAHEKNAMCDSEKAFLVSLYRLMKEAIDEHKVFYYPGLYGAIFEKDLSHQLTVDEIKRNASLRTNKRPINGYEQIIQPGVMIPDHSVIVTGSDGKPTEIILVQRRTKGEDITLSVRLIPPPTVCKSFTAEESKRYSTLAIHIDRDLYNIKAEELKNILTNTCDGKRWVKSPLTQQWLEKKVSEQHEQFARYMERQKQEREKRLERERQAQEARREREKQLASRMRKRQQEQEQQPLRTNDVEPVKRVIRNPEQQTAQNYSSHQELLDRLILCKQCGERKPASQMAMYGGSGEDHDRGLCSECARKL